MDHLEATLPDAVRNLLNSRGETLETISHSTSTVLLRSIFAGEVLADDNPRDMRRDLLAHVIALERAMAILDFILATSKILQDEPGADLADTISAGYIHYNEQRQKYFRFCKNLAEHLVTARVVKKEPSSSVIHMPPPGKQ